MKPGFFIDRPVFSTVLSILIVIVGIIGLALLPVVSLYNSWYEFLSWLS